MSKVMLKDEKSLECLKNMDMYDPSSSKASKLALCFDENSIDVSC
jgi:hypothetical protein